MNKEREDDHVVDLGVASEKTLGPDSQGIQEGSTFLRVMGISDLD